MRKILIVVSDIKQGGITTSAINFCNELIKRGEEVTFLNMGKRNIEVEKKIDKKVNILILKGKVANWNLGINDLQNNSLKNKVKLIPVAILKKLTNHLGKWLNIIFYRYHLEEKYDIAIAFRQCAPCYYFVLNCVDANKKLAFIHGDINYMSDISSWDIYFKRFNAIACVSNSVRNGFQERYLKYKEKFITIYNMFDVERIEQQAKIKDENIYIDHMKCNIVTVARIENETKRIDIIPEVCKILKRHAYNKFHWYIIGDGPDLEKDMKLSSQLQTDDVLTFCGAMENPYFMIGESSFTVLPSRTEAYSMVVIESLILNKPIVVSHYSGVEEAVENGVTGLISNQSIEDLVEKIKLLILDKKELSRLTLNLKKIKMNNDKAYNQFLESIS